MVEDISRNTVIMLVALTLIVSIVGTWAVIDEMSRIQPYYYEEPVAQGNVRLSIVSPDEYVDQTPVYDSRSSAVISIVDPEDYNG